MRRFDRSCWIAAPVEAVFAFHERPEAFALLTPPWQRVEIVERRGGLEPGAELTIRLHAGPFSVAWIARHTAYERNRLFVDEQTRGPFRSWRHEHLFEPRTGGTWLTDRVEYSLRGGRLVEALLDWVVRRQLGRLFRFRHEVTRRECETGRPAAGQGTEGGG